MLTWREPLSNPRDWRQSNRTGPISSLKNLKYLESSSAGEIKTCISNIRISLNFWESLKRNTLFVKHQQPFLFLIFCVKLLLSFWESETTEIKLETRCFSSLRLTDYRRRAPISLLWETPLSIKSIMRIKEKIVKPKS